MILLSWNEFIGKKVSATMIYKSWHGFCLCGEEADFPSEAQVVSSPFAPLVFLVRRDPMKQRGYFAIHSLEELTEEESIRCLCLCEAALPEQASEPLAEFVQAHGAGVLNLAFQRAFLWLLSQATPKHSGFKITLVGLGDVGGTVLTGLKLLGQEIDEIAIFDPNQAQCARYEMEMNQILSPDGRPLPNVTICPEEELFDCDLFAFTASRGVPGLNSGVKDVRMAQFEANRDMLDHYAKLARAANFQGIFCQISDPVDNLARSVFLASNRDESGQYDFAGLLPEQVQGFGLGVMAARAAYLARKEGIDFTNGQVYGPHGQGLIVANDRGNGYDTVLSENLTRLTREANLRVRELGFKPYIAPGLSSAAISLVRLLRGQDHYGAVPLDGAYFGCLSRFTPLGVSLVREVIHPALLDRLSVAHQSLREFDDV